MTICNVNKLFVSCSQQLEIFFLPAVPTEHLDRKRQPQIPMSLHAVKKIVNGKVAPNLVVWNEIRRLRRGR